MTDTASPVDHSEMMLKNGWASPGTLAFGRDGILYKIYGSTRQKYKFMDADGRDLIAEFRWFNGVAEEGTVWAGPEKSRNQEAKARRAEVADTFSVGDIVELTDPRDVAKFPGHYLIAKRTNATRFAFVGVGTGIRFTGPATGIRKVSAEG